MESHTETPPFANPASSQFHICPWHSDTSGARPPLLGPEDGASPGEKTSEPDQFFQWGSAECTRGRAAGLKCAARLQKDSLNEHAGDQGKPLKIPLGPKGTCCLGLDLCSPSCPRLHLSLCPPCILLRFYHISSSGSWKSAIIAGPVRPAGERGRARGGGQKARERKGANGVRLNRRGTFFVFGQFEKNENIEGQLFICRLRLFVEIYWIFHT